MKRRPVGALLAVALLLCVSNPAQALPLAPHPVLPSATQDVVFDDGPARSLPSPALWGYDLGPYQDAGLQTYTNAPENVRLDGRGRLVIHARRTPSGFTSARSTTRGKLDMRYGTVAARIKFSAGQGIWPDAGIGRDGRRMAAFR